VVDVYTCSFRDKEVQARYDHWQAFFHGDRNLAPVSMSDDGKLWVVSVSGPDEPGAYYLFNMDSKTVERLGDRTPELAGARLGKMRRFAYKARDGTEIPAYLTAPPEAAPGPLPLIVMPHGGPEARDSFDFDSLAQYLATRGYLVFQPNFRGSGGYGLGYAQAGYGQWGGVMADDVTDGVKALVDQGLADPKRICIAGGSYGGYAALQAGGAHPELYRCVISWDGVADLNAIMKWEKKNSGGADTAQYRYWLKSIGDPDRDKERLSKASPVSLAASYQPPVLMFHGEADDIVPVDQSRLMEQALKKAGKKVRLEVLKNEGHGDFSDDNAKKLYTEIADFLSANMGSGSEAPAAKP
jgi:dipeptidyl aminopeptidase/acylaminoacyl peptidase